MVSDTNNDDINLKESSCDPTIEWTKSKIGKSNYKTWLSNTRFEDTMCHNEKTGKGNPELRNTNICKLCPYNKIYGSFDSIGFQKEMIKVKLRMKLDSLI